ncbi:ATP-dependent DNA helicase PcrA, partial [Dehalococcoidia bacterium]|nr:ATP-dependent DNA helicase PcrA [Dehalococcoidia bacterium]
GGNRPNLPSSFLKDIPAHLVVRNSNRQTTVSPCGEPTRPQTAELKAGDRVHHAKFGDGTVVNAVATRDDHEVTVAFGRGVGVKRLLVSLAPLERLS